MLDHYFDDSSYSGKEAFVDATTGALGGGLVNPMIRLGSRANKVIRHSGRQVYKVGSGATESLLVAGYVTKPMISRPVRMEMLAGAAAGLVYDIAYKSSGSSSERNGTHVGPGGTVFEQTAGGKSDSKMVKPVYRKGRDPCPPGYRLRTVNGKRMCVIQ